MKKKFILFYLTSITFLFISKISLGQVGIGTDTPKACAALEVFSNNKGVLLPSVALKSILDQTTIASPDDGLIVYNNQNSGKDDKEVLANNLYIWNNKQWNLLITDHNVKNLKSRIHNIAIFETTKEVSNFLQNHPAGKLQEIPMAESINNIKQYVSFNAKNNEITFQPGVYTINLSIEAIHNAKGCTLSSYFVDLPSSPRRHIVVSHLESSSSNHGGAFQTSVRISTENQKYIIKLGRGQSGNCTGKGMNLNYAQLSITRIGG